MKLPLAARLDACKQLLVVGYKRLLYFGTQMEDHLGILDFSSRDDNTYTLVKVAIFDRRRHEPRDGCHRVFFCRDGATKMIFQSIMGEQLSLPAISSRGNGHHSRLGAERQATGSRLGLAYRVHLCVPNISRIKGQRGRGGGLKPPNCRRPNWLCWVVSGNLNIVAGWCTTKAGLSQLSTKYYKLWIVDGSESAECAHAEFRNREIGCTRPNKTGKQRKNQGCPPYQIRFLEDDKNSTGMENRLGAI